MSEDPVVTKVVYPITWPETQAIEKHLRENRPEAWYEHTYRRGHADVHKKLLDGWRAWSGIELGDAFPYSYATFGATDAIKECLVPGARSRDTLYTFTGEYEDYARLAHERHWNPQTLRGTSDHPEELPGNSQSTYFFSLPRSMDGEYGVDPLAWVKTLQDSRRTRPKVFIDLTYVGVVKKPMKLDLAKHPNITAVIFSLSKAFGVYFHRIGGIFSREPIPVLERNASFKNLFSLELGAELMKSYRVDELPKKYAPIQEQALQIAKAKGAVPASAVASNAVLLARANEGPEEHKRCDGHYRYCLTPTMEKLIRGT